MVGKWQENGRKVGRIRSLIWGDTIFINLHILLNIYEFIAKN
jgi:hypothetical protein